MNKKLRRLYHKSRSRLTRARARTEHALHVWTTTENRTALRRFRRWRRREKYLKRLTKHRGRALRRGKAAHREGVDYAYGDPSPVTLKQNGKTFVCRYLTSNDAMCITKEEYTRLKNGGIDVVLVYEEDNEAARMGSKRGIDDARHAIALAKEKGLPDDCMIRLAADFDATGREVESYFRGAVGQGGKDQIGGYGGLAVISFLLDEEIIADEGAWQTYAWSHHAWDHRCPLRQVLIDLPGNPLSIDGVAVDFDKSTKVNFGQI